MLKRSSWLPRLLGLWLGSFAGLLLFLYFFFIGWDMGGSSMFEVVFR